MKALHLLLLGGVIAFGVHCASSGPIGSSQSDAPDASLSASALVSVRAEPAPIPRIVLQTTGSPSYTSYSPQPEVFVVDLPRTSKAPDLVLPPPADWPAFITTLTAYEAVELGSPLTRVTIRTDRKVSPRTQVIDGGVTIEFDEATAESLAPPELIEPEPVVVVDQITSPAASQSAPAVRFTGVEDRVTPGAPKATRLFGVRTSGSGPSLVIILETNGVAEYKAFRLSSPERIVIDLSGVKNVAREKTMPLGDPYVKRIRLSQFATSPQEVTRVVLDLDEVVDYRLTKGNESLKLSFGDAPIAPPEAIAVQSAGNPAPNRPARSGDLVEQIPAIAESYVPSSRPAPAITHVVNAPQEPAAPPRRPTTTLTPPASDDVFIEPTERRAATIGGTISGAGSRRLSGAERIYTGEPIDLNLKDADIKDVLRLFAQLTGLNIAIDPQVSGTVTVDFAGVPWDQALELILRQNGLAFELDGNVMRIGTLARLSAEQAQERKLEEDKRLNVPLTTISHKLSYARAGDIQGLLKDIASPRAKIVIDSRTNQLIITEIPEYLQTMLNMIETIDIATPQVVIEARIVETTKNFSRQLGVSWGFQGALDPALGTGTGLQFPNRIGFEGGPFDFGSGNSIISLTLGNVLGTFDLDLILTAAENEGLVRIVSAPKVTTQDNEQADIESGVQIPLQTRVNFTTTVTYINATLRLGVRPQITEAGTVIMEIQVQKVEPALGLQVVGTANSPLLTRRAQTKLMVRDGGTTVIGGIYQATENQAQSRVPFVHSIPVIGNLFKNRNFDTRHDELLIFITPRIVRNT
ncbi:MAG TPA: type IV pilus secretin PilQ [Thermoanaerobaculia bacterium]|nr:type IV pilus secretin PilQ [Thermoanaerobaculia bacterium]